MKTELVFGTSSKEDRYPEFVDSDYTFLNEKLASITESRM